MRRIVGLADFSFNNRLWSSQLRWLAAFSLLSNACTSIMPRKRRDRQNGGNHESDTVKLTAHEVARANRHFS